MNGGLILLKKKMNSENSKLKKHLIVSQLRSNLMRQISPFLLLHLRGRTKFSILSRNNQSETRLLAKAPLRLPLPLPPLPKSFLESCHDEWIERALADAVPKQCQADKMLKEQNANQINNPMRKVFI